MPPVPERNEKKLNSALYLPNRIFLTIPTIVKFVGRGH
jgi:hypothetical protein